MPEIQAQIRRVLSIIKNREKFEDALTDFNERCWDDLPIEQIKAQPKQEEIKQPTYGQFMKPTIPLISQLRASNTLAYSRKDLISTYNTLISTNKKQLKDLKSKTDAIDLIKIDESRAELKRLLKRKMTLLH